jgi:hypothetical protein
MSVTVAPRGTLGPGLNSRALQLHVLRTSAAVVCDGNACRSHSSRGWRERHPNQASSTCRHACATICDLCKVAGIRPGDRNTCDAHRNTTLVGESDFLDLALRPHSLIAEIHACWDHLDIGPGALERYFLRTARCVVRDRDGAVRSPNRRWSKGHAERATAARVQACTTGIGLAERTGDCDIRDIQNSQASVGQRHLFHLTGRIYDLNRESQAGWRKRNHGLLDNLRQHRRGATQKIAISTVRCSNAMGAH